MCGRLLMCVRPCVFVVAQSVCVGKENRERVVVQAPGASVSFDAVRCSVCGSSCRLIAPESSCMDVALGPSLCLLPSKQAPSSTSQYAPAITIIFLYPDNHQDPNQPHRCTLYHFLFSSSELEECSSTGTYPHCRLHHS